MVGRSLSRSGSFGSVVSVGRYLYLVVEWFGFKGLSLQDSLGNWGWMADPGVKVSCLEEPLGDKIPPSHFYMAHNPHQVLNIPFFFLAVQNSSIGDLVTHSLTD